MGHARLDGRTLPSLPPLSANACARFYSHELYTHPSATCFGSRGYNTRSRAASEASRSSAVAAAPLAPIATQLPAASRGSQPSVRRHGAVRSPPLASPAALSPAGSAASVASAAGGASKTVEVALPADVDKLSRTREYIVRFQDGEMRLIVYQERVPQEAAVVCNNSINASLVFHVPADDGSGNLGARKARRLDEFQHRILNILGILPSPYQGMVLLKKPSASTLHHKLLHAGGLR